MHVSLGFAVHCVEAPGFRLRALVLETWLPNDEPSGREENGSFFGIRLQKFHSVLGELDKL